MIRLIAIVLCLSLLPSMVSAKGPSKEETIAWLFENLREVGFDYYMQDDKYAKNQKYSIVQEFDLSEDLKSVIINYVRNYKAILRVDGGKFERRNTKFNSKVRLSDLSTTITTQRHNGLEERAEWLILSCRMRRCVSKTVIHRDSDPDLSFQSSDSASKLYIIVTRKMKDRVGKALSHLIRLSGGADKPKKEPF